MSIAIREDLASWQLTNTVGHIAAYLGNKMSEPFDTGKYFTSQDGVNLPRNSQFPMVALRANREELSDLAQKLRSTNLLWIVYVQEMIETTNDAELEKALSKKPFSEMDILGVGVFGEKEEINKFTKTLKLWK